jgi:hypothetical protein
MEAAQQWEKNLIRSFMSPSVVAEAVTHALISKRPKTRYPLGLTGRASDFAARFIPDRLRDWLIVRQRRLS